MKTEKGFATSNIGGFESVSLKSKKLRDRNVLGSPAGDVDQICGSNVS